MAITNLTNYTSPVTPLYATTGSERFARTHVAYTTQALEDHDHSSGKGLGVLRVQTGSAPASAGQIQVTGDTFVWWGATAAATRTAVAIEGTQTISGTKTFSGNNTHSGTLAMSGVLTFSANPVLTTANKIVIGNDGTTTDLHLYKSATRTAILTNGPTQDGTGVVLNIGTTGTDSSLRVYGPVKTPAIYSATAVALGIGVNGAAKWNIDTSGHLQDATGNTQDIGVSGHATSPRTIYAATSVVTPTGTFATAVTAPAATITTATVTTLTSPAATALTIKAVGAMNLYSNDSTEGWKIDNGAARALYPTTDNSYDIGINGTNDVRNIYLQNDIYKAGVAYTNPDYVFEKHFTGKTTVSEAKAASDPLHAKPGLVRYKGLKPLEDVEAHVRQHHRFETIPDRATGMFERGDIALELLEEAYLHMFDLNKRIKALEAAPGRGR